MGGVEGQVRNEQLDAEREARRRRALAQIRQYPDPVLRMEAKEVEEIDDIVQALVERMSRLMAEARGVGLAATQVGILRRVLVYQTPGVEDDDDEEGPLVALVNPRIVSRSEEKAAEDEGCLSLGASSVIVEVERPTAVTVKATSPQGEELRIEAEGLEARIIQHEVDHLDGILIIDRTTDEQRRGALAQLRPQPVLGPLV